MKNVGRKRLHTHVDVNFRFEVGKYAPLIPLLEKIRQEEKRKKELVSSYFERVCINKTCYSKKEAQTKRNELNRKGKRVRVYQCQICDYWHLTHKDKQEY